MAEVNLDAFACLAYICRQRGLDVTTSTLTRRFGHVGSGLNHDALLPIAREIGLTPKVVAVAWRDLQRLAKFLPAIVPLRDGSTAVLEGVVQDAAAGWIATLRAPAVEMGVPDATVVVDERQLSNAWLGKVILLKRKFKVDDETRRFDLSWVAAQVLRERVLFRDITIASLFITFFGIAPAFIVMVIVDKVIVNHSTSTLWVVAGTLIFIIMFEMILSYLRRAFILTTATRIDGRINLYIMDKLLKLPMGYFEQTPKGMTLGQLGQIFRIRQFLTGPLFTTTLDMITLIVLVPLLFILSWKLSIFVLVCAAMIFVVIYIYLRPMGQALAAHVRAERDKGIYLTETVYGMRAIKSLVIEDRRKSEWDARVAAGLSTGFKFGAIANYPQTFSLPFERAMYSGSFVLGAALMLADPTGQPPGVLLAFAMLAGRTAAPLVQLARLMSDFGEVQAAVAEVSMVMNQPPEDLRIDSGIKLPVRGAISFKGVDYRYAPGSPLALSNVTFNITPGAIFGIMGRSGSGKTTITRLLQGLSPDYEGLIKIDGMDLREMDLHHLRLNIGVVPQENFLFSGSVRENIGIAVPGANMARIVRAAQLAGAEEFIERMPRGYDTILEEGATNLSGGQRQRLALARALLIDPPVLILDEATSALDAESEAIINANLTRIASDRTIICVSHRLSMLVPASAILVMERGQVYDIGRHDELLLRCDIYKHMWHTQNRHSGPVLETDGPPYAVTTPKY